MRNMALSRAVVGMKIIVDYLKLWCMNLWKHSGFDLRREQQPPDLAQRAFTQISSACFNLFGVAGVWGFPHRMRQWVPESLYYLKVNELYFYGDWECSWYDLNCPDAVNLVSSTVPAASDIIHVLQYIRLYNYGRLAAINRKKRTSNSIRAFAALSSVSHRCCLDA